ncbi:MAG: hypothetical protein PVI09_14440, partial [Anaerolineae bacterium]
MSGKNPKAAPQTEASPPLASSWAIAYGFLVGLSGLAILVVQLARQSTPLAWLPILVFAILSLLVQRSSFHF